MRYDILLNDNLDLQIGDNDFQKSESTQQHQKLLLLAEKGTFKHEPTAGVGLPNWLNDDKPGSVITSIKNEFRRDGMTVQSVQLVDGKILTEAYYE